MRSALLLALLPALAAAQTVYSWEDAEGLHYTDNLANVPKAARNVTAAEVVADPPMSAAPAVAVAEQAPPEEAAKEAKEAKAERQSEEARWRKRFVDQHRHIEDVTRHLSSARAALPPRETCTGASSTFFPAPGQPTPPQARVRCHRNPEYDRQAARIAELDAELETARADLVQLDREASYAAVPREWRRGY